MSTTTDLANTVSSLPQTVSLNSMIEKSVREIGRALPQGMNPERVVRIALTCISQNPALASCTPESFIGSLLVLAQLGLEPQFGRAYLLPFNNKKKNPDGSWTTKKEVTALIGYKGYADLFYRHEASLSIDFQVVCANDRFEYQYGTSPFLNHVPKDSDRGEIKGYYAVARLRGGASLFRYMTQEECMKHGMEHSKTWIDYEWKGKEKVDCIPHFDPKSPWATDSNSMCLKTVLIQLSKLLPLSVEMQKAISVDETSRDYREGITDAISLPVTTVWELEDQLKEIEKPVEQKPMPGGLT
jgi:recombination protein RecT